jgi:RND family efflux transporter MFP subunit
MTRLMPQQIYWWAGLCALLAGLCGCQSSSVEAPPSLVPAVPVSKPVQRVITDFVDFTGRTDAVQSLSVRARVTGYLVKIPFKEGAEVKEGDLLFQIDPRPYKAALDLAKAKVNQAIAQLNFDEADYQRNLALAQKSAVSQHDLDKSKAARDIDVAALEATKASLEQAKLNLDFTEVRSPINGRVSRYYLTLGNLVNQDQTLLTTVVSLDPMYAYFDMDERTLLRIRQAINEGKIQKHSNVGDISVAMALPDEPDFRHAGNMNFFDNTVNPSTGTLSVRGEFPNSEPYLKIASPTLGAGLVGLAGSSGGPLPAAAVSFAAPRGVRLLTPGMFVRIRLPIGSPHQALLVIDRALGSDQGIKYVYVVDKDKTIRYQPVQTGALQEDGLRVIEKGLESNDLVVIGGLQQLRPKMKVEPDPASMPTLTQPAVPEATKEKAKMASKKKR